MYFLSNGNVRDNAASIMSNAFPNGGRIEFDGDFSALPRRNPHRGAFVPPRELRSDVGTFYVAVLNDDIAGGRRRAHEAHRETLLVELISEPRQFTMDGDFHRNHIVPARFFWLDRLNCLREADLFDRKDNEGSLTFTAYEHDGEPFYPLVHRVLGFTFACPPYVWGTCGIWGGARRDTLRPSNVNFDVNHMNRDHGDNALANLQVMRSVGQGGHRQLSILQRWGR